MPSSSPDPEVIRALAALDQTVSEDAGLKPAG